MPVYLGVTLDRSLLFVPHLKMVADKVSKRVNLIKKLVGSSWNANFTTLHTSVLALVYSAAEYAAHVWSHSHHTSTVDTVLNDGLRAISGCMAPTHIVIFPVVAAIAPSSMPRNHLVLKLAEQSNDPNSLVPSIATVTPP